jgi:hypothetical protein
MDELSEQRVDCPYCGETLNVLIDSSELGQQYIEDCQVCCRPIIFSLNSDEDGQVVATVRSEDEAY